MLKEQCGSHMVEFFYIGFFFVNHKKNANVKCPHTMKCIICYNSLMIYYTTNEIIILKKHLNANHFIIAKKCLRRKWIVHWKEKWRNNLPKKGQIRVAMQLLIFLLPNILSRITKRKLGSWNQSIYDFLWLFVV
jgi:hypothetical protein